MPTSSGPRAFSQLLFAAGTLALFALTPSAQAAPAGGGGATAAAANPAQPPLPVDGLALLRTWVPPVYPPALLKARTGGMVTVRLVVSDAGQVTSARALEDSDPPFVESAIAAVKAWVFAPAIENGQAVASCLDTLVTYSPDEGQRKALVVPPKDIRFSVPPRTAPEPKTTPPGEYPSILSERKFGGRVKFACQINSEGRVLAPRITVASHVDFVLPAIEALKLWEFTPARQGDLAVSGPVTGVVVFDPLDAQLAEVLTINGITAADGGSVANAPEMLGVADPVWPLDALLKGEAGAATVEFTVTETGMVEELRLVEATAPDFGLSLLAAMQAWIFNPAIENNRAVAVRLRRRVEFKPPSGTAADTPDAEARVLAALRQNAIGSAKGLDARLAPLYRVAPEYPAVLKAANAPAPAGRAELEIVIDRDGRVRLPRIISATQPEFGWAAATAVVQWVFAAPRRGGEPVDVKARIPFDFAAPKD
jgi:TonB family protein